MNITFFTTIGKAVASRLWQKRLLTFLVLLSLSLAALGLYTLNTAPALLFGPSLENREYLILGIEGLELPSSFKKKLPEFVRPDEEVAWWEIHARVYHILKDQKSVTVTLAGSGIARENVKVPVGAISSLEVVKKTGLVYFVSLIFLISGVAVFHRHHSLPGSLLAFFLIWDSIYFTASAPVISRSLTLPPLVFKILVTLVYISAGGLITLVHFAFLFPTTKKIIRRFPVIHWIFYIYALIMIVLYLIGLIGFGAPFPFLSFWVILMVGTLLHSLVTEDDRFLKRQIGLSLLAPLMAGLFFAFLYLLPGILDKPSMTLSTYALFSLFLPFALPSAMENVRLYRERIKAERRAAREKEETRRGLHDCVLTDLANISLSAELSLSRLETDTASVREKLRHIKACAVDSSRQLRDFLWMIDEEHASWNDFCDYLRCYGYEVLQHLDISLDLSISKTRLKFDSPPLPHRICLYHVFREALLNIIKHAKADQVSANLSLNDGSLTFTIKDNGIGFDKKTSKKGHFGLRNMERRVEELTGVFSLDTAPHQGTSLIVRLPL